MKIYEFYRELMINGVDRSVVFDILRNWECESILMNRLYEMVKLLNLVPPANPEGEITREEFAILQIKDLLDKIKRHNEWEPPTKISD